jgi:cell division protein FtsB
MAGRQRTRIPQRKALLALLVLVGLVSGYSIAFGPHGVRRYLDLRATLSERAGEAYERIERNREVTDQIERLRGDDRMLESLARSRLGVAGPDEVVLVFPDESTPP